MTNTKDLLVVGYPRTGERFLSHNYESVTRTFATISHRLEDLSRTDRSVVTIIRDPLDSVSSAVSMGLWQKGNTFEDISYFGMLKLAKEYVKFYQKAIELDNIVFINFKDIADQPLKTIQTLASVLGHDCQNERIFSQKEIEDASPKSSMYRATSKNLDTYQHARKAISEQDLSGLYEIYYKCLDRCIIVPSDK